MKSLIEVFRMTEVSKKARANIIVKLGGAINVEEDYKQVPISVLKYISELENQVNKNIVLADVRQRFSKMDLEDMADDYVNEKYESLDKLVWHDQMNLDRKIYLSGLKKIYYDA